MSCDVAGVLQDFASLRSIGLAELLSVIPRLQPRAYSVASSARRHPGEIQLCVALVRAASPVLAGASARRLPAECCTHAPAALARLSKKIL